MGSASARFFGWVIGGTLPVALAADWLTSTWDQNAASNVAAPAEAVVEETCGEWMKELLRLPKSASFAFVTGCQMAHTTALAAAPHKLLRDRGWNVETSGLTGAPRLKILTTENRHDFLLRAVRLLGSGMNAIDYIRTESSGRIVLGRLKEALARSASDPVIVWLQAGDLNTGIFDPFEEACVVAHVAHAWVHIDGAFGLWAATSPRYRHLLRGAEQADSWATDGHKWLNLPFDSGMVFVAHPAAHRASFAQGTELLRSARGGAQPEGLEPRVVTPRAGVCGLCRDPRARPGGDRRHRRALLRPRRSAGAGDRTASENRGAGGTGDQSGLVRFLSRGWRS